MAQLSDQDRYAPNSICFGCGPANQQGLQIKSHWEGDPKAVGGPAAGKFVMEYTPQAHHQAFPGVVNGGILGTLLDCHSNWCAVTTIMKERGIADEAPSCVTAEFHVKLKRPTPVDQELTLVAWPAQVEGATALMHKHGWDRAQCTVTADFHVRLKRPTPAGKPLRLEARVESIQDDRAQVHCDVLCDGKVTATCDGLFVAVKEGHPAYHRWG